MEHDWYTSDREHVRKRQTHTVVRMKQAAIMFMVLAIMVSMLVPVWQSAVNRALEVEYRALSSSLKHLEEQQRLLRSQIAQKTMPEALAQGAWREDIFLQQIDADSLVMVGRRI
ncbi:MAG TPA: hypothetical protein DCG32_00700 [Sphaerochaeta sp.]|nr:hypothetical protein [Sphaerochaeta sp.]